MSEQLSDYTIDRAYGHVYSDGESYIEGLYGLMRCLGEGDDQATVELAVVDMLRLIRQVKAVQARLRELRPTMVVYLEE